MEKITWLEFNRSNAGKPFVTAYNGEKPIYTHELKDVPDFLSWCAQVGATKVNMLVAETDKKIIPKVGDFGDDVKPQPTEWIPFATKHHKMPTRSLRWPKKLVIHWTAGSPDQKGQDGIEQGAKNGFTYLFLERSGRLWQGAPTNAGGYHAGNAIYSSFDCLGVEVACAGRLEKIGELYAPWFAKVDGKINAARCIPKDQVIYDADGPEDDESFKGYYQLYSKEQMEGLTKLALYCCQMLRMNPSDIVGHDMIATPFGRKVDPGFSIGEGGMPVFRKKIADLLKAGTKWEDL
jgi:hypothetical protein